jgi:hypothetical protein
MDADIHRSEDRTPAIAKYTAISVWFSRTKRRFNDKLYPAHGAVNMAP